MTQSVRTLDGQHVVHVGRTTTGGFVVTVVDRAGDEWEVARGRDLADVLTEATLRLQGLAAAAVVLHATARPGQD